MAPLKPLTLWQKTKMLFRPTNTADWGGWLSAFIRGDDEGQNTSTGTTTMAWDVAMKYSVVNACVRILAETNAVLPIMLYRKQPNKDREESNDIAIYDVIRNAPNPEMTAFNFKECLMTNICLGGNAFAQKMKTVRGELVGLYPIEYGNVEITRNADQVLMYKIKQPGSTETLQLTRENIFHIPGLTMNGINGLSPIGCAAKAIQLGLTYETFCNNFYANGANTNLVVMHPMTLKDEAYNRLKKQFDERYTGLANANRPILLQENMTVKELTINPIEAQLIESKNFQVEDICRIFRVPQHLVQKLDRCMPGDTLVYTTQGPVKIEDIHIGDRVWTLGNTLEISTISNKWDNGVREVLEIRTTNRAVSCTANHRLLVRRQNLRPSLPGEKGGKNENGKKMRVEWGNEYVEAGQLKPGDVLISLDRLPDLEKSHAPNGRKLTVGFMEFCGLLLGDGNINKQNGRPSHVSIARSKDASYMDYYRGIMQSEFSCYDGGNGRGDKQDIPHKPVTLIEDKRSTRFASVMAAQELTDLGLSGTAFTKSIPEWVYGTTEKFRLAILRGFLDADGTVDKLGRITYYSANKGLLDGLRHLCLGLGVPVTNTRFDVNKKPAPNSTVLIPTCIWRFTCSDPKENSRIGTHDARYIQRLANGKPFGKKGRKYPRFGGLDFHGNGISLSKIVKIETKAAERVYDIEVENSHCFIADGIISHNSTNNNIEHQSLDFVMYTMLPWLKRFEDNINLQLLTREERMAGYFVEYKVDALLRGDSKTRAEAYANGRQWGWLSVNDIRRLENLPRVDNGDIYLQPVNMVEAGKQVQQIMGGEGQ